MKDFIDRYEGPIVLGIFLLFSCLLIVSEIIGWSIFSRHAALPALIGLVIVPLLLIGKTYGLIWAMYRGLILPLKHLGLEPSTLLVVLSFLLDLVIAMFGYWLVANCYYYVVDTPLINIGLPSVVVALLALAAAYPFTIGTEAIVNTTIVVLATRENVAE